MSRTEVKLKLTLRVARRDFERGPTENDLK